MVPNATLIPFSDNPLLGRRSHLRSLEKAMAKPYGTVAVECGGMVVGSEVDTS